MSPASPATASSLPPSPTPPAYRPRHPERLPTYRLLERHFEAYVRVHEERFAERHGTLRAVVSRSVDQYLECGRLVGGFARIQCPNCRAEHLLAFSCRTRNLCASCQAKRSVLFGERLVREVVAGVGHRHVVFTIPIAVRGVLERDRSLLGALARTAYEALSRVMGAAGEEGVAKEARPPRSAVPGMVASIQTFGSYANFHPHIHAIVTEGVFALDGTFHPIAFPPMRALEEVFRRLLLAALVRRERLSEEFCDQLLSWRHSGFSVFVGTRIEAGDVEQLERLGRYVTRPALATGAVRLREDGRVEITTKPDPKTGAESIELDPLDFVHALVTQIPDARKHLVRYYGGYSHRMRATVRAANGATVGEDALGAAAERPSTPADPVTPAPRGSPEAKRRSERPSTPADPVTPAPRGSPEAKRRSAWRRLVNRVFEVDPLVCATCGHEMKVVAWITDPMVIERILGHREKAGLVSPFEPRGPPAPA